MRRSAVNILYIRVGRKTIRQKLILQTSANATNNQCHPTTPNPSLDLDFFRQHGSVGDKHCFLEDFAICVWFHMGFIPFVSWPATRQNRASERRISHPQRFACVEHSHQLFHRSKVIEVLCLVSSQFFTDLHYFPVPEVSCSMSHRYLQGRYSMFVRKMCIVSLKEYQA